MDGPVFLIDPVFEADHGVRPLLRDGGEFALAMRRLGGSRGRRIPHRTLLELYAYELLERMREWQLDDQRERVLWFPFWPTRLLEAAECYVHSAHEIVRMYPAAAVRKQLRDERAVREAAMRFLGGLWFDPQRYVEICESNTEGPLP